MRMGCHGLEPPSWLGGIPNWLSPQDHKEWVVGKEQLTKLTTSPIFPQPEKGKETGFCVNYKEYLESPLLRNV